jgi:hypothetical protein
MEYWHLLTAYSLAEIDEMAGTALGITLVSNGVPLGFGGVFFQKNQDGDDVAVLFFHGGPNQIFVKKYKKLALIGMRMLFTRLRDMGVHTAYAIADKRIEKSANLTRWLGGYATGLSQDEGDLYAIPIASVPLIR